MNTQRTDEKQERLKRREELLAKGIAVHPAKYDRTHN